LPKRAAADFIRFWTPKEIREVFAGDSTTPSREKAVRRLLGEGDNEIKGLATVSFLGLLGEGGAVYSGVAGGVNAAEDWGPKNTCTNNDMTNNKPKFQECFDKYHTALGGDVVWKATSHFFKNIDLSKYYAVYGSGGKLYPYGHFNTLSDNVIAGIDNAVKPDYHLIDKKNGPGKAAWHQKDLSQSVGHDIVARARKAIKEVAKVACTSGEGYGFGGRAQCSTTFWLYNFLGLPAGKEGKSPKYKFGDLPLVDGEAALGFKSKRNLHKRQQQQVALQAGAETNAAMLAYGRQLMERISTNTMSYVHGAAYVV